MSDFSKQYLLQLGAAIILFVTSFLPLVGISLDDVAQANIANAVTSFLQVVALLLVAWSMFRKKTEDRLTVFGKKKY